MDLKEAMAKRHTVRKYLDKPLSEQDLQKINEKIEEINQKAQLHFKLISNDTQGVSLLFKLLVARNAKNYIILAGEEARDLAERIGYYGAELMLYAQTIGLNTWWIGETYTKKVESYVEGDTVIGIIVIGYGQTQGHPHRSKKPSDVSIYEGEAPEWFLNGVKAALLAPTAINRQAFQIYGKGNTVEITYRGGKYQNEDLGIVKYHFELGAGKENFSWK